jgi:RNA-directed DNA polymerase
MWKRLRNPFGGLFGRRSASTAPPRESAPLTGAPDLQTGLAEGTTAVAAPSQPAAPSAQMSQAAQASPITARGVAQDVGSSAESAGEAVILAPDELDAAPEARDDAEGAEGEAAEDEEASDAVEAVEAVEADEDETDADEYEPRARPTEMPQPSLQGDRAFFGAELWGVSERHRSAVFDAEKLGRFALPLLATERDLAGWLGISRSRLRWYTHDRPADTTWHYVRYTVPKRSGGERIILAPKRELKALQRKVLDGILARVPTAAPAHGFVRHRSIVTNAQSHVGKQVVLKLDLKDFFPSITYPRVRGLFISLGYSFAVASALALLCTEYEREPFERDGTTYFISIGPRHLVQGAPTSPGLANLVAWRLDRRLSGLAARHGFVYTRYADDLTFSGDSADLVHKIRMTVQHIVADEHFEVNTAKTRIACRSARQIVTGLVVNDDVATPRELRRRLRATFHNARSSGLAAQNRDGRANFPAYLQGLIAYVNAASPEHAARLRIAFRLVAGDEESR